MATEIPIELQVAALRTRIDEVSASLSKNRESQADIQRSVLEEHRATLQDARDQATAMEQVQARMDKLEEDKSVFALDQRIARAEERRQGIEEELKEMQKKIRGAPDQSQMAAMTEAIKSTEGRLKLNNSEANISDTDNQIAAEIGKKATADVRTEYEKNINEKRTEYEH